METSDIEALLKKIRLLEEEAEKQKEESEQRLRIAEEKLEKISRSLTKNGFPALNLFAQGSLSTASVSKHPKAKLELAKFAIWETKLKEVDTSIVWALAMKNDDEMLEFSCEQEVANYVKYVLDEVIDLCGLKATVETRVELGIFQIRPDIWVIMRNSKIPLGVIEVKRPSKTIMENENTHGQIYDYMLQLRTFYGLEDVFGIVSTYNQWRIYWLPECDHAASAKYDPSLSNRVVTRPPLPNILSKDDDERSTVDDETYDGEEYDSERLVHGTKIFDSTKSDELISALTTVLQKMNLSSSRPVILIDKNRPYIVMEESRWTWRLAFSKRTPSELRYNTFPKSLKKLILVANFQTGRNGRVWLACSLKAEVCVVKFSGGNDRVKLQKEKEAWFDEPDVDVISLGGHPALVMPYFKTLQEGEIIDDTFAGATTAAIVRFAKMGLVHPDIRKRHLGYRSPKKKGDPPTVHLIDREETRIIDKSEYELAVKEMQEQFQSAMRE